MQDGGKARRNSVRKENTSGHACVCGYSKSYLECRHEIALEWRREKELQYKKSSISSPYTHTQHMYVYVYMGKNMHNVSIFMHTRFPNFMLLSIHLNLNLNLNLILPHILFSLSILVLAASYL